ncbi:fatty acyl-AMP ligase [Nostocales cyanobacterium LEGE 12452]|nr:fatty acyl-AMP ligase [Nostocales cyanobacterium LEGE 12452]
MQDNNRIFLDNKLIKNNHSQFFDIFFSHSKKKGDALACVFQTHGIDTAKKLTYRELSGLVLQRAQLLLHRGYMDQPIALLFPNGLDFVVNFLACLASGVIAVPLNLSRNAQQMERTVAILDDAGVETILTTAASRIHLEQQLCQIPELSTRSWTWIDEYQSESTDITLPVFNPDKLALLQYTSGSTSSPKGVMVSHHNIVENQRAIQEAYGHQEGLIAGGWLPQFHDMGLIGHMLQPLFLGGTYVFMPPMNFVQRPRRWLELISQYRIHTSASPNFGYKHCVKCINDEDILHLDLSSWQVALNGSEPIDVNTMKLFSDKFQHYGFDPKVFSPCYGLAESTLFVSGGPRRTGSQILMLNQEVFESGQVEEAFDKGKIVVNCGLVSSRLKVRIVAPETSEICEEKEIGEIWISGSSVAQGYWKNLEKTEECFHAQLKYPDGRYYLRTGDMGFIHKGMLFVTGRIKEILFVRGRNLYPYDIENTCNNYDYALGNNGASVFTIDECGESKLVAIVEIKKKALTEYNHGKLINDLQKAVMDSHNIAFDKLILVKPGTIPKTSSGKIKRNACKDLITSI